ncbi:MAG: phosphatidylglycerophosphatase A [Chlorobium sp.]|nr:phosphatidylglycerophosphatase A [Chlorobium sp.]
MKRLAAKILSTCFGIGYFPVAPGTVTSIVAVICYYFIPILQQPPLLLSLVALCTVVGVWSGTLMEEECGEDPSIVTIDELAGQWLALAFLPDGWLPAVLSLAFFRYFDIAKPGPVDAAQRFPGGWGIMADDLLAGLFANLAVRGILVLFTAFYLWVAM